MTPGVYIIEGIIERADCQGLLMLWEPPLSSLSPTPCYLSPWGKKAFDRAYTQGYNNRYDLVRAVFLLLFYFFVLVRICMNRRTMYSGTILKMVENVMKQAKYVKCHFDPKL